MLPLLLAVALTTGVQRLPELAVLAELPAPTGSEGALVDQLAALLPPSLAHSQDVFGTLIVRRETAEPVPVRTLVAVGLDTTGYVVSQIRDDGYLRLRTLGARPAPEDFHLLHEGRPVTVLTRRGELPGVIMIPSLHLGGERPEVIGEEHLFVDVGGDDPGAVAMLGVELLDAVVSHEVVTLRNEAVAGPGVGRRAVALALLRWLHAGGATSLPPDVALAFVVQSLPGAGPLGRGGESVLRALAPTRLLLLDAGAGGDSTEERDELTIVRHELPVSHAGSPVELVLPDTLRLFEERLAVWMAAEGAQR